MIGRSPELDEQVSRPHRHVARVEVVRDDVVVATLEAHAGQVVADRAGAILRRCTVSLSDPTGRLTPVGIRDLLAPFGTIIKPYRGVWIPVIEEASLVADTAGDWAAGTRWGTSVDDGDLVLGTA